MAIALVGMRPEIQRRPYQRIFTKCGEVRPRLDDDGDLIVVPVTEPVERH
jgi:hypothetical protein